MEQITIGYFYDCTPIDNDCCHYICPVTPLHIDRQTVSLIIIHPAKFMYMLVVCGMAENGRIEECWDRGMVGWRNSGMAERLRTESTQYIYGTH